MLPWSRRAEGRRLHPIRSRRRRRGVQPVRPQSKPAFSTGLVGEADRSALPSRSSSVGSSGEPPRLPQPEATWMTPSSAATPPLWRPVTSGGGRPALRDGVEGVHLVVGRDLTPALPADDHGVSPHGRGHGAGAGGGQGSDCCAPRPGREVEDVDLGDRADEGVGLGRRAAACEHEAVPHDHGQEMITGARSSGRTVHAPVAGSYSSNQGRAPPLWPWLLPPTR